MIVKVKRLNEDAVIPKYAKLGDAGLDLVATDNGTHVEVNTFEDGHVTYREYGTGLAVEIPEGFVGLIFPRSSISKTSLALTNCVGVIDSGYRGEIRFRFRMCDDRERPNIYLKGDKIGQLIVMPYPTVTLVEAETLSNSQRGTGGFGSSGK